MRAYFAILFCLISGPAFAHIGHLGEVAGHGHWLGAAALGAAIALGLWQGQRGKAKSEDEEGEDLSEEEPQEA